MAHEIVIDKKGRWNDHSLQNVAILACEVFIYIGIGKYFVKAI